MKKVFKFLGILILVVVAILFVGYLIVDKPVPNGTQGDQAEELADEMLAALNKPAFDSLKFIQFTYVGLHSYAWDLENNQVTVSWDENEVFLDLNQGIDSYTMLQYKAYQYFINDSFWLIAPFKVRDDGVVRSTVKLDEGRGLLVSYSSGGLTPGDSYLWILDEKGFPKAWRLWTSNVPIGGLEISWAGWQESNGVWFSTLHENAIKDLIVSDLEVR